jgi:hypothetical protein
MEIFPKRGILCLPLFSLYTYSISIHKERKQQDMPTIQFSEDRELTVYENQFPDMIKIEVAGCIINIRPGLEDQDGNPVTSIEIRADDYPDEQWSMPDHGDTRYVNVRVVRQ